MGDVGAKADPGGPLLEVVAVVVVEVGEDVLKGLLAVAVVVVDAVLGATEEGGDVGRSGLGGSRDDPGGPGRVDLADLLDLAAVVVLLGGEVLPHERVGRACVHAVTEVLEVLEHLERERAAKLLLHAKHKGHHVRARANARHPDAVVALLLEVLDALQVVPPAARRDRPAKRRLDVLADNPVLLVPVRNPPHKRLRESNHNVDLVLLQRRDQMARPARIRHQLVVLQTVLLIETVLLCQRNGRGEMFWNVSDSKCHL